MTIVHTSDVIVRMLLWTSVTLAASLYASGATAWLTPSGKVQPDQSPSQVLLRHCQVMTPLGFSEGCTLEHCVVKVAPGLALGRNGAAGQAGRAEGTVYDVKLIAIGTEMAAWNWVGYGRLADSEKARGR